MHGMFDINFLTIFVTFNFRLWYQQITIYYSRHIIWAKPKHCVIRFSLWKKKNHYYANIGLLVYLTWFILLSPILLRLNSVPLSFHRCSFFVLRTHPSVGQRPPHVEHSALFCCVVIKYSFIQCSLSNCSCCSLCFSPNTLTHLSGSGPAAGIIADRLL